MKATWAPTPAAMPAEAIASATSACLHPRPAILGMRKAIGVPYKKPRELLACSA